MDAHRNRIRERSVERCLSIIVWLIIFLVCGLISGCFVPQKQFTDQHQTLSLKQNELSANGIAFITPSTATGQEEEKQGLALMVADILKKKRTDIRCVTLAETLSAVNKAGLSEDYKGMYTDYRDTGLFKKDILKKVGDLTGTRYVAQLKLANFNQGNRDRLSVLGLRLIETRKADIRLILQIWDTTDGTIVWEGAEELSYATDTPFSGNVPLRIMVEEVSENLIANMP
jgi:hypothetical protein